MNKIHSMPMPHEVVKLHKYLQRMIKEKTNYKKIIEVIVMNSYAIIE